MRRSTSRRAIAAALVGACLSLPLALASLLVSAGPADASSYRYWTYWWGRPTKSAWQFATQGPGFDRPGDEWVVGWRFQTTDVSGGGSQPPRQSHTYADLCSDPAPSAGATTIRIAVVIDYGTAADAPPGETPPSSSQARVECVSVPAGSHTTAAMSAAGINLRADANGFICGIDGYPRTECGTTISASPTAVPSQTPAPSSPTPTSAASSPTPKPSAASQTSTPLAVAAPSPGLPSTGGAASSAPASAPLTSTTPTVSSVDPSAANSVEADLPAIVGAPVTTSQSGSLVGVILGILGVALLAGSAWFTTRRRGEGP